MKYFEIFERVPLMPRLLLITKVFIATYHKVADSIFLWVRSFFYLACIFLGACTLNASLVGMTSATSKGGPLLPFDISYLDFDELDEGRTSTSTNTAGHSVVELDWAEYVYKNKVKFVNLPDDAELVCEGADPNAAVGALDLETEKSIRFNTNFWVPTEAQWAEQSLKSFSCHYEVQGTRSVPIEFKVKISENKIIRASIPSYTGDVPAEPNSWASTPSLSADGRYVAFTSYASNLVPGDTNNVWEVFVHDRQTGVTERVAVSSDGEQGNGVSVTPSISADGRYVAFAAAASNLVAGDLNSQTDIFVRDRVTGVTSRVSVDSNGVEANNSSSSPVISANGRYVAFSSKATNLVIGDGNNKDDIFVHDRQTGVTKMVSINSSGVKGNGNSLKPSISGDGQYIAFESVADNLVADDGNFVSDIFVHHLGSGVTTRVSVNSSGTATVSAANTPAISANGRYVAFVSASTNLVIGDTNSRYDIFVHDRQDGVTTRVSVSSDGDQADDNSLELPALSSDGRHVVFSSHARNLVEGDSNGVLDIFLHDRQTGVTERVSLRKDGTQDSIAAQAPAISADGRYVAFISGSPNLVEGDTNGAGDVFIVSLRK